mmetsp:Transcript_27288/g.84146  ORF Transcript_27288/g.84146 Transcript_27288/m.84146 type:complete len:1233 (-) Transcript_27288:161-3859(-)
MKRMAACISVEFENVTMEVKHPSLTVFSTRLLRAQFQSSMDGWAFLTLGPAWMLFNNDEICCLPEGGHVLINLTARNFEIDVHAAAILIFVQLVSVVSAAALLKILCPEKRQRLYGHKSQTHVATSHHRPDFIGADSKRLYKCQLSPKIACVVLSRTAVTLRVTVLSVVSIVISDSKRNANFEFREPRLRFMPGRSLGFKAAVAKLHALETRGRFNGLDVRVNSPVDISEWAVTAMDGMFTVSDLAGCRAWLARCLATLEEMSTGKRLTSSVHSHRLAHFGSLLIPLLQIDCNSTQGHRVSIILQGLSQTISLGPRGVGLAVEAFQGFVEVDCSCSIGLQMDDGGAQPCRIEMQHVLEGVESDSRQFSQYLIEIPRFQCTTSDGGIRAVVDVSQEIKNILMSKSPNRNNYNVAVNSLDICLSEDGTSMLDRDVFFSPAKCPSLSSRDCILVSLRALALGVGDFSAELQISVSSVAYDSKTLLQARPEWATDLLKGPAGTTSLKRSCTMGQDHPSIIAEHRTSPVSVIAVSVWGLAILAFPPPAMLALLDKAHNQLSIICSDEILPACSLNISKYYITLHDTVLEYFPEKSSNNVVHAIKTIGAIKAALTLVAGSVPTLAASCTIKDVVLFLNKIRKVLTSNASTVDAASIDFVDKLDAHGFAQIACLDIINVTAHNQSVASKPISFEVTANSGRLYFCSDSLGTLLTLICALKEEMNKLDLFEAGVAKLSSENSIHNQTTCIKKTDDTSFVCASMEMQTSRARSPRCQLSKTYYRDAVLAWWYDGSPPKIICGHMSLKNIDSGIASEVLCVNVCIRDLRMCLFAGCDWNKHLVMPLEVAMRETEDQRNVNKLTEIITLIVRCQITRSISQVQYDIRIGDIVVLESVSSNDCVPRPAIVVWQSDPRKQCENKKDALSIRACIQRNRVAMKINALPLRCRIDAEFVRFLDAFFGASHSFNDAFEQHGVHAQIESSASSSKCDARFSIEIAALTLKLDYIPQGIDLSKLREGSLAQLIQIFAIERVQVTTRRCRVAANTPALAWSMVRDRWSNELSREQIHKFVFGASILRPLHEVGTSIVNTIQRPLQAGMCKDQWRVLTHESTKCGRVFTYETARMGRRLITHVAVMLEATSNMIEGRAANRLDICPRPLDLSNPHQDRTRACIEEVRSALCRGLDGAYDAGLKAISSPSLSNFAKAAPLAILRPAVGAVCSVSMILLRIEQAADDIDEMMIM